MKIKFATGLLLAALSSASFAQTAGNGHWEQQKMPGTGDPVFGDWSAEYNHATTEGFQPHNNQCTPRYHNTVAVCWLANPGGFPDMGAGPMCAYKDVNLQTPKLNPGFPGYVYVCKVN